MGHDNKMLRHLALGATLVLALALGACGGDDNDDDNAGGDAAGEAASGDAVQILDFQFDPTELTVQAGATVTFTNDDDFAHTAEADDSSFDTGNLDGGASGEVTLAEPGEYPYFCAIHNYMKGTITVE